ncbi:MAG: CbtB-domain containing protein [Chromatiales bacterium]|nr:CbtB-domain containing protein [Chromatiales bacterium]
MLSLGTMEEESMMNSAHSRTGLQAVPDARHLLPALAAAMLGAVILFGVALANSDTIHNAAHDTRHAAAFPCH